jgi:hypothetical protein
MTTNACYQFAALPALAGLLWLTASLDASGAAAQDRPRPELRLVSYEGELCPPGSLGFSFSDGGLTITTSVERGGEQTCHIEAELVVPADQRFRTPAFTSRLYAIGDGNIPASQASFTYCLGREGSTGSDCYDGSPDRVGGETFPKTIVPVPIGSNEPEDVVTTDYVNITVPECSDPTQPMVLPFNFDIKANVQANSTLRIYALDAELTEGIEWTTCEEGF